MNQSDAVRRSCKGWNEDSSAIENQQLNFFWHSYSSEEETEREKCWQFLEKPRTISMIYCVHSWQRNEWTLLAYFFWEADEFFPLKLSSTTRKIIWHTQIIWKREIMILISSSPLLRLRRIRTFRTWNHMTMSGLDLPERVEVSFVRVNT